MQGGHARKPLAALKAPDGVRLQADGLGHLCLGEAEILSTPSETFSQADRKCARCCIHTPLSRG